MIDSLPGIKRAVLVMAYDNGCINREHPQAEWLEYVNDCLTSTPPGSLQDIVAWEAWLVALSEEGVETLISGESDEIDALGRSCPKFERLDEWLDELFEGG